MFVTKEIDSSDYWDQLCSEKQCESHWSMQEDQVWDRRMTVNNCVQKNKWQ
jgi:hypothetical protein